GISEICQSKRRRDGETVSVTTRKAEIRFRLPLMSRSAIRLLAKVGLTLTVWLFAFALLEGTSVAQSGISLPTDLRLQNSGWWPRKGDAPRDAYVGSEACVKCHHQFADATTTAMAHAASRIADSESLRAHPELKFTLGEYAYSLISDANDSTFS